MKVLRRFWDAVTMPFTALAVALDESRRINEDGSWDKYWAKKNRKESQR